MYHFYQYLFTVQDQNISSVVSSIVVEIGISKKRWQKEQKKQHKNDSLQIQVNDKKPCLFTNFDKSQ